MGDTTLSDALQARRTVREFSEGEVPFPLVKRLVWAAQGRTDASGRKTVPSAHALHPLRLKLSVGRITGLDPGLYTIDDQFGDFSREHGRDLRPELEAAALEHQPWIGASAGVLTVCADLVKPSRDFAEQPPYGCRGLRYVYIEAGAAAQCIALQAASEGLGCVLVAGFKDEATAETLGLKMPLCPVLHVCFGWRSS